MMNRIAMPVLDIVFLPDLLHLGERGGVAVFHVCDSIQRGAFGRSLSAQLARVVVAGL